MGYRTVEKAGTQPAENCRCGGRHSNEQPRDTRQEGVPMSHGRAGVGGFENWWRGVRITRPAGRCLGARAFVLGEALVGNQVSHTLANMMEEAKPKFLF